MSWRARSPSSSGWRRWRSPSVGLAGLFVLLWCLLNFTRELHGFAGLGRAAVTLILAVLGLGIGLSLILALIGVGATTSGA